MTSMQFFLYPVTFFGNPILAMVNGVLLLSVVSLPRAVERGEAARRREIVGRGGEKQGGRGGREWKGKWKRSGEFRDDGVSRCGKFISTITGARRMAANVR